MARRLGGMSSVEVGGGPRLEGTEGDWSSGMIPALGAGGREFDSRITPFCYPDPEAMRCFPAPVKGLCARGRQCGIGATQHTPKKKTQPDAGLEPATSRLRACHSTD